MFRLLLILVVLAIGYDAVANQGVYTRQAWGGIVGMTDSAIDGARRLGEGAREEARPRTN